MALTDIKAPVATKDRLAVAAYLEGRMDGTEVDEPQLLEGLPLYQAIRVMLLLGGLASGKPPWRAHYHPRDAARHDIVALGFKLSSDNPARLATLVERLPEFYETEYTAAYTVLDRYAWIADCENGSLSWLGGILLRLTRAVADAHPRRRGKRRWYYV
ncbi:hypothetical protein [Falsiroseomonas sp. HW251]|uniref:hypothetical protein n=1 Tax=Falsiroseomonas sp. HW251 TaxID=3390998 RepID=UPI003D313C17